jgi:hypothetical protein
MDLDKCLDGLAERLERRSLSFLAGFVALYLLGTGASALHKALWFDELATAYLTRLSSVAELRAALANGADANPIPFYLVTRLGTLLFGEGPLVLRLPEMLGVLMMCLCVYKFVARRCPLPYAWLALLFPFLSTIWHYAYEARPYGLMMGFCGLALLCWQWATDGRRRLGLIGLAGSLAAGVSCHFATVFVLVGLGLGELIRSVKLRRLDKPVWLAMGGVVPALAAFLPLTLESMKHLGRVARWAMDRNALSSVYWTYDFLSQGTGVALLIGLVLLGVWLYGARRNEGGGDSGCAAALPAHEVAAAVGLAVTPLVVVALTALLKWPYTERYAVSSVVGFALLAAFVAYGGLGRRARMAVVLALILSISFAVQQLRGIGLLFREPENAAVIQALQSVARAHSAPIVVEDEFLYFQLAYQAPAGLQSRVICLHDSVAALRYVGSDPAQALLNLGSHAPLNMQPYNEFLRSQSRFLVWRSNKRTWLIPKLLEDGKRLRLVARTLHTDLIEVTDKQ